MFLPSARYLWQGNVFTPVCHSVHRGCLSRCILGYIPSLPSACWSSPFKDPISHMCLAGAVVASWSLTQEMAVSSPFNVMTNMFVPEFAEFNEDI